MLSASALFMAFFAFYTKFLWSISWLPLVMATIILQTIFCIRRLASYQFNLTPIATTSYIFILLYFWNFQPRAEFYRENFFWISYERQYFELFSVVLCFYIFWFVSTFLNKRSAFLIARFSRYVILFELLGLLLGLETIDNPQYYSYLFGILLPCSYLDRDITNRGISLLVGIFIVIQIAVGNRVPAFTGFFFYILWQIYPWLTKHRSIARILIFLFFTAIISIPFMYVEIMSSGILDAFNQNFSNETNSIFDKGLDGRMFIWPDLINEIFEEPFYGHCSNCSTEYFYNQLGSRNISSHNLFLEILFRLGLIGLILLLIITYHILVKCLNKDGYSSNSRRFVFCYLLAGMIFMSFNEFGLTQTFTANCFFWMIISYHYRGGSDIKPPLAKL